MTQLELTAYESLRATITESEKKTNKLFMSMSNQLESALAERDATNQTIAEKDGEIERLKSVIERKPLTWGEREQFGAMSQNLTGAMLELAKVQADLSTARAESLSSALQVEAMRKALEDTKRTVIGEYNNRVWEVNFKEAEKALSAPTYKTLAQVREALEKSLEALDFVAIHVPRFTYVAAKANGREAWVHDLVIPAQTAAQSALALIGGKQNGNT